MDHPAQRQQRRLGQRYRAFIDANPSWPSQTSSTQLIEAALWDDHRDDATVMAWFENEKPLSAKGKFSLAKALLARGDRAGAERLIRDAWRFDSMSSDTEETALDLFGALLTPGDQKADGTDALRQRAGSRHARGQAGRPGRARQGEECGVPQSLQHKSPARRRAERTAWRSRLYVRTDSGAAPGREIPGSRATDAGGAA